MDNLSVTFPVEPAPLGTAAKIDAADRDQDADLARLRRIISTATEAIAELDPNLRAEVLIERTAAIRSEALPRLGPLHEAIVKRSASAKAEERSWTPEAIRRAALRDLEPTRSLALFAVLQRSTTSELIEFLRDAAANRTNRSLAEAEVVRLEFARRDDKGPFAAVFGQLLSAFPIPDAMTVRAKLKRISGAVAEAEVAIQEFAGRSDPMARLSAHRARNAA